MFQWVRLDQRALLFDAPIYVFKAFVAIAIAYGLRFVPFIQKDMISVLFAVMLTLEPHNKLGFQRAWEQFLASVIGGGSSLAVLSLFGINSFTVPFVVALTLYLCLRFNWRFVTPAAYFTAIYMSQYVQLMSDGTPDFPMTFALRLSALGAGILIALIVNELFARIFYRKMQHKRLAFVFSSLCDIIRALHHQDPDLESRIEVLYEDIELIEAQNSKMDPLFRNCKRVAHYLMHIHYRGENISEMECRGLVRMLEEMLDKLKKNPVIELYTPSGDEIEYRYVGLEEVGRLRSLIQDLDRCLIVSEEKRG
ncbi:MAG: aromatic acid exporter family protein [Bacillota bacterium]|nr:aromatic acid exporter family protein [Bacillota bacterium]